MACARISVAAQRERRHHHGRQRERHRPLHSTDIAQVVDDGDNLRVLPIVGRGVAQNVKDVMFLRGVDMGITQANVLKHYAKTGELGSDFMDQIV